MGFGRDCVWCGKRIEPDDEVRVTRHEERDLPGRFEPVIIDQPGFVHPECEQDAQLEGWYRDRT
jgi:hypothetical protein